MLRTTATALVVCAALAGSAHASDWKLGVRITPNFGGGVYVNEVFDHSPAKAVGLRAGNVILSIDGRLYNDPLSVREKVMFSSGSSIDIIYQDGADFWQVKADLVVVTAATTYGTTIQVPKAKGLTKSKVADPRKAAPVGGSGRTRVSDPRK